MICTFDRSPSAYDKSHCRTTMKIVATDRAHKTTTAKR